MTSKAKPKSLPLVEDQPPREVGSKPTHQAKVPEKKGRLHELTSLVTATAKAKGWDAYTAATDNNNFKYATVAVSRTAPNTYQQVTGTFEITCDEKIKITYHTTSFNSWGLEDLYDAISNEFWNLPWVKKNTTGGENSTKPATDVALLERLLRRFHRSVRQLKHRYADRPALAIEDEYDVQNLLHTMLRSLFDDIRPEEYTPSYAGGASRMDFLLKSNRL